MEAQERKENEAVFWDKHVTEKRRLFRRGWYTQVNRCMWEGTIDAMGDLTGKKVLFFGCGESSSKAAEMARRGGQVWCLDISPASIEEFERFKFGDLRARIHPVVGDAEAMPFESGTFDVVVGKAIVHHLNIPVFLDELQRVAAPGARIVLCEPLATNPCIGLFRWLTPGLRVPSEHPFWPSDIRQIAGRCQTLRCDYRDFLTGASFPLFFLGLTRSARWVYDAARTVESLLFRFIPGAKWLAWSVVISGQLLPADKPCEPCQR